MIVLDTNVLSEVARPDLNAAVLACVAAQRRAELCTTAISKAELAYGLALLAKTNLLPDHPIPEIELSLLGADGPAVGAVSMMRQSTLAVDENLVFNGGQS